MTNVLLIGKPNSGKSLLFQKVTGFYQHVANFPGVTVEIKKGEKNNITWIDFPGSYSINPITQDEEIAITQLHKELENEDKKVVVCLLDATQLERSLVIALQAKELAQKFGCSMILAVNMIDEIKSFNGFIDFAGLEKEVGLPVIGISAKTEEGLAELEGQITKLAATVTESSLSEAKDAVDFAKELNSKYGLKEQTYVKKQNRIDKVFLSNIFGGIIFLAIMLVLFQSIFTWASPLMDLIEESIAGAGALVSTMMTDGPLKDFINDAIFGGLGSFIVFVPQIAILTFIVGILEDSGYLARASIISHLPFKFFGLSGKSFVPYLSGHACAIPAIIAARAIESPRKRLITMLTIPFTSCSARLPVYALLITAFIPATPVLGGFITFQGIAFFLLYFLGIFTALIVSLFLNKFLEKSYDDTPFIIELPRYRVPSWLPLVKKSMRSAWAFIVRAGPIIFVVNLVIWGLGYFPQNPEGLSGSYLAVLGHWISPIFEPLGVDWRYGVAILVSFLAREVFVGTLGTLFGIEGADENIASLADSIRADGLTLASGIALLVFYALAMQCVSTLAVIQSETGSKKAPVFVFVGYTLIAYFLALLTYYILA